MDFNFKKIASDASGFFSRAKQVISLYYIKNVYSFKWVLVILKFNISKELDKFEVSKAY